jgi:hypothetical protein
VEKERAKAEADAKIEAEMAEEARMEALEEIVRRRVDEELRKRRVS